MEKMSFLTKTDGFMAVKEKVFIIKFMKPMNKKYGQIARFVILNHVGFHVHMVTNLL